MTTPATYGGVSKATAWHAETERSDRGRNLAAVPARSRQEGRDGQARGLQTSGD